MLTERGLVVSQAESPFYEEECQRSLLAILRRRFRRVHLYNYSNLIYPGGLWSFSFAAKGDTCPVGDLESARVEASAMDCRYYTTEIHRAAFVLPAFQQRRLQRLLTQFKIDPGGRS